MLIDIFIFYMFIILLYGFRFFLPLLILLGIVKRLIKS